MSIRFKCEHCGKSIKAAEKFAGKNAKCPDCTGSIRVPALPVPLPTRTMYLRRILKRHAQAALSRILRFRWNSLPSLTIATVMTLADIVLALMLLLNWPAGLEQFTKLGY